MVKAMILELTQERIKRINDEIQTSRRKLNKMQAKPAECQDEYMINFLANHIQKLQADKRNGYIKV